MGLRDKAKKTLDESGEDAEGRANDLEGLAQEAGPGASARVTQKL